MKYHKNYSSKPVLKTERNKTNKLILDKILTGGCNYHLWDIGQKVERSQGQKLKYLKWRSHDLMTLGQQS